jgi:DNA polymerase (family 10)
VWKIFLLFIGLLSAWAGKNCVNYCRMYCYPIFERIMTNPEIAQHFSLLADLLELHGENAFKIKSYTTAADTIDGWPVPLVSMSDETRAGIPGIGQAIGDKIRELLHAGEMNALRKLMEATPSGVREMLSVNGLSAKKAGAIWRALGVETIDELAAAAQENKIAPLKGFGAKTQETILEAVAFYKKSLGYAMWAKMEVMALELIRQLEAFFPGKRFGITGALRRQEDVLNTLELVTDLDTKTLQEWIQRREAAVLQQQGPDWLSFSLPGWPPVIFYAGSPETYSLRLFRTTGSPAFVNTFTREYAMPDHADSEETLFTAAGIKVIPPALRMSADSIRHAADNALPELIVQGDVRGLIHCHSTYSDGKATLAQMALAARDRGLEYMVISDHSQAAQYAKGLYPDRILQQHREIDTLNAELAPFKIFKSIEADILADGSLDYNPKVLATFDLVIASVHSTLKMDEAKAMKRLLSAIANPFTTILGHMTGRLLLRRPGYPVDHKRIIDACAEHKVVLEINANPRRLDMDWAWISYALEKGVLLSVNPDAHSVAGIDDIRYGVLAAQKGGLTKANNLSSYPLTAFESFLENYRFKRNNR